MSGLLLLAFGLILLTAHILPLFSGSDENGRILLILHRWVNDMFGWTAFLLPFIFIAFAGCLFSSDRLKLVKLNAPVGMLFIFISLNVYFGAGTVGGWINTNLVMDFQKAGTYIIGTVLLVIGAVLFFDTSIDRIVPAIQQVFQKLALARKYRLGGLGKGVTVKGDEDLPIPVPTIKTTPQGDPKDRPAQPDGKTSRKDMQIRPVTASNSSTWVYPPLTLLKDTPQAEADRGDMNANCQIIESTLESFGIKARVVDRSMGPTVTQYALAYQQGVKLTKITALAGDLALRLATKTGAVRIQAPIPGKSLIGVEIPNIKPQIVTLRTMLESPVFDTADPLMVPLGLDVAGNPVAASIGSMPHALIAGTTGSGKSVMLNAWLATILFRTRPDEVRMILVDPKRVELSPYNGVPHLIHEVIVDPPKVLNSLKWTVNEMDNRYKKLEQAGTRNIESYNKLPDIERLPYIIYVIDELADLMMVASKEAEDYINRIAQKARAVGIHLVLATQRPSVDIITGLLKSNIPTRLAFNVSSSVDSRVIIDDIGAEKLLGKGDMMYKPPDASKPQRIQGAFVDESEIAAVVGFLKSQVPDVQYMDEITKAVTLNVGAGESPENKEKDPLFQQAVDIVSSFDKASASLLQRRLKIGYARAARLLDELEAEGIVGPSVGSKPREVLIRKKE